MKHTKQELTATGFRTIIDEPFRDTACVYLAIDYRPDQTFIYKLHEIKLDKDTTVYRWIALWNTCSGAGLFGPRGKQYTEFTTIGDAIHWANSDKDRGGGHFRVLQTTMQELINPRILKNL